MWPRTELVDLLGIDHPIIQAPMSGPTTPALAAAVSNAGGVGSLGCAELSLQQLRGQFDETRSMTTRPFNINFFAHDTPAYPTDGAATMRERLATYYEELGLGQVVALSSSTMRAFDEATLETVLELRPDIVSFHFGLPAQEMVDALKSNGTIILCSATTVAEARQLENAGVHAIVAQGYDAGGHRGTFIEPLEAGNVGTFSLVPQVVDAVSVPVIAAGGIADGRGIAAAFALGASGVQMGTAFLLCPESTASPLYREALQQLRDDGTRLTRAFTGRPARAITNRFVEEMAPHEREAAPFPLQDSLTLPLHVRSEEQGLIDFAALLTGQAASLNRALPAGELIDVLVDEARSVISDDLKDSSVSFSTEIKVTKIVAYSEAALPAGIRSRFVENINGLTMHMLEAGYKGTERPCVLLLHGFPELAYSWRKLMLPIASAGFHVIAPDQRGYGRTTGWDGDYDGDVGSFRILNLVRDALGLVSALGYRSVAAVVGHDYGSPVAAYCSLVRPDVFRSVVLMSAPFAGPPSLPFDTDDEVLHGGAAAKLPVVDIHGELAALDRPRKHYQWYYSTREADDNMRNCPQGVHAFLRDYFHYKSADWKKSEPFPLQAWTADELAKLPTYYVMDLNEGMAETVARERPSATEVAACEWLPDDELSVYSAEYARTGFQGGLQWYRCKTDGQYTAELQMLSGRTIDVPSCFIAGNSDWGIYQVPGDLERMQETACTQMLGCHLVDGAGHWVQQEQPEEVSRLLLQFLKQ